MRPKPRAFFHPVRAFRLSDGFMGAFDAWAAQQKDQPVAPEAAWSNWGEGKMNRLQKFIEQRSDGDTVGRVAYAFGPINLPEATAGFKWHAVSSFSAGDELIENAGLKEVFRAAIVNGCALVKPG